MTFFPLLLALASAPIASSAIQPNDNQKAAGRLDDGVLTVKLVADMGSWQPNGPEEAAVSVAAFGEEGGALSTPGPLIRAAAGTTLVLTLRNALPSDLRVSGLCAAPSPCEPLTVAAGSSREVRFALTTPGTYYYWGSMSARTLTARPRAESQLGGAIVVDPAGGAPAADRILVLTALANPLPVAPCGASAGPDAVFVINGASWPHTTRLRYSTGDRVHWRIINLSCDQHAMHLHGFHFDVESEGNGSMDRQLPQAERRTVVTEAIQPGRTFTMSWTPARPGNWLFHCHMVIHMTAPPGEAHGGHDITTHAGMAGLVIGVEVVDVGSRASAPEPAPARRLSLVLTKEPGRYGDRPGYRAEIEGIDAPRLDPGPVPGPVMVLRRGEPAEVTVVNRMTEPTAIHWHGIEIESFFDGVPGFGGTPGRITAPAEPGQSVVVRMTPPRAGTFIYHTHWHDEAQLAGGLYGPLIVLEPGEQFDPSVDHIAVIGLNGVLIDGRREPFALNGRSSPAPIVMKAGVPNRLRLINITPNNVALTAFLVEQFEPAQWKPIAKDGAPVPAAHAVPRPARQPIAVGETYDFEIDGTRPRNLWLEVRRGNGEWVLQAPVRIQ